MKGLDRTVWEQSGSDLRRSSPSGSIAVELVESRPIPATKVLALQRIGGLHHRYTWSAAA